MKYYKYYLIYFLSFLFLGFIWIGPSFYLKKEMSVADSEVTDIQYSLRRIDDVSDISIKKEEKKDVVWTSLDKLNTIITLLVGLVNTYFVIIHIKKRKKTRPKKIGRR